MLLGNMLLAVAWAALQGEFSLQTLLIGQFLGYLILLALVRGGVLPTSPYIGRVHRVIGLAGYFLRELVSANIRLAVDVATPHYNMRPGIVAVPLDATTDAEILLLSMLINTTPGSVALDVSSDRKVLYVHVMYMTTPDAARQEIKSGFERRVLGVLG
jgi:multicomponent Na+:H+ antiporter subunit E